MEYSKETHELIKRIEEVNLRQSYVVNKDKVNKLVEQAYKLFGLQVPEIIWCEDIRDKQFQDAARDARAAGDAWAARAARDAWAAGDARAARAAGDAWAAWAARDAWAARAARAARAAWDAWAARAAWAADYDFGEFIFCHEYKQTKKINENDEKFLQASELFLQLKEAGLGYWAEKDNKLFVCPNPIIQLDSRLRYHSLDKPAIKFSGGLQLYYLMGVNFEKSLWHKIVSKKISGKQILKLKNIEQRYVALSSFGADKLLREFEAVLLDKSKRGNELYSISSIIRNKEVKLLKYSCPSTGRVYTSFVPSDIIEADKAMAWKFSIEDEEYKLLEVET